MVVLVNILFEENPNLNQRPLKHRISMDSYQKKMLQTTKRSKILFGTPNTIDRLIRTSVKRTFKSRVKLHRGCVYIRSAVSSNRLRHRIPKKMFERSAVQSQNLIVRMNKVEPLVYDHRQTKIIIPMKAKIALLLIGPLCHQLAKGASVQN